MRRLSPALRSSLSCAFLATICACAPAEEDGGNDLTIGLLLPFTGSASATAANLERAAIYAVDRINQGGGVKGQNVRILSRDTHSELARSRRSAQELIDAGAVVLIGPESPEIARDLAPLLADHGVLFLSPLIGASTEPTGQCQTPWFRLAPSARSLGEALAKQAAGDGAEDVVVMYAAGDYNQALRDAVARRFVALGGRIALEVELDPGAQSYAADVRRAMATGADAVVLATSPRAGALVVNEFDAASARTPEWFLSPLLKTELLVQNVAPEALEGAVGVAPKVYDRSDAFPRAFGERWLGDQPLEGAYFYYDAVALVAFSLEKAERAEDGRLDLEALEAAVVDAAAPPGESAGWNEIELGLSRLRDGDDVYYSGLTGPMLLDGCGSRRLGVTSTFRVQAGRIVDE